MSGYTSSIDSSGVASTFRTAAAAHQRVLVLTHAKADGDAMGSALSCVRTLLALGAQAEMWLVGPFSAWLDFASEQTPCRKIGSVDGLPPAESFDLIVIVDTGSWAQLDLLGGWLKGHAARCLIVDHHINGNAEIADRRHIVGSAASCTEVLAPVIAQALALTTDTLPVEIATPLYLGLCTDTGWFKYSNTGPGTLRLAADLLTAGVNAPGLYELIEQQSAEARPRLLGRALSRLEVSCGGRLGVMSLTLADFQEFSAESEDSGGFAEHVLAIKGMAVVATLTETTRDGAFEPLTKCSMRSKPGPFAVDVAAVCAKLGGGGHARAAGVKIRKPLADARQEIVQAIETALVNVDRLMKQRAMQEQAAGDGEPAGVASVWKR